MNHIGLPVNLDPALAPESSAIRRNPRPHCPACGSTGAVRYDRLADRWFGTPGEWRMRVCSAQGCGAWYLDPMPYDADIPLLYERYYTHSEAVGSASTLGKGLPRSARLAYLSRTYGYRLEPQPPAWHAYLMALVPGRREQLDFAVLGLESAWRGPLLDVGCGSGAMLRLMQDLGWDAQGIDMDPRAVAVAQAEGLRARVGTLEDAQFQEQHFAVVTSSHVIEHVLDPKAFLQQCLRVTRPEGRLVLTTPNAGSLGHRLFGGRWRGLEPPRHFQVFTPDSLERLAASVGYEDVQVKTSARLAAIIARDSVRPDAQGPPTRYRMGHPVRIFTSIFQIFERALLPFWHEAGEELILSARSPRSSLDPPR